MTYIPTTRTLCFCIFLFSVWTLNTPTFAQKTDTTSVKKQKIFNTLYKTEGNGSKERNEQQRLALEYIALSDTTQERSFALSYVLDILAHHANERGNRQTAIALQKRVIAMRRHVTANCDKNNHDGNPRHIATALTKLAHFQSSTGDYETAIHSCQEALDIFSQHNYGNSDKQHAQAMYSMAAYLISRGDPEDLPQAITLCKESCEMLDADTEAYITALHNLSIAYSLNKEEAKAATIEQAIIKRARSVFKKNPFRHACFMAEYMVRMANRHLNTRAFEYARHAESMFEQSAGKHTSHYASFLTNYGQLCINTNRLNDAETVLQRADTLIDKLNLKSITLQQRCLQSLTDLYNQRNQRNRADYYQAKLEKKTDNLGITNVRQGINSEARAKTYQERGEYTLAIRQQKDAINIYRKLHETTRQANAMQMLAQLYIKTDSLQQAVDSANTALRMVMAEMDKMKKAPKRGRNRKPDVTDEQYVLCLTQNTLSQAYYAMDKIDSALLCAKTAVERFRQHNDTMTTNYTKALSNMALYSYYQGDTLQGIRLTQEACHLQDSILGISHPDNISPYFNLAVMSLGKDDLLSLTSYSHAIRLQMENMRGKFSFLTSTEREKMWNERRQIFKSLTSLLYINRQHADSLTALAYDMQMFTKGLLLNSEINFVQLLRRSKDATLLEKYEQLDSLRHAIDALSGNELLIEEQKAKQLERELMRSSKEYGDFMSAMNTSWKTLKDNLQEGEMAIEIINGNIVGRGDTYMAVCLKREWETPKLRVLFSQRELDEIGWSRERLNKVAQQHSEIDSLYNDEEIGKIVWSALDDDLKNVNNLYFSPSGIMLQLAVEYLNIGQNKCMADQLSMHRLSSTRLLTQNTTTNNKYRSAAIFGGLSYNVSANTLALNHKKKEVHYEISDENEFERMMAAQEAEEAKKKNEEIMYASNDMRSAAMINPVEDLAWTKQELFNVAHLLKEKGIAYEAYETEKGIEERFKELSNKQKGIIHVATHGFAITTEEAQQAAKKDARYNMLLSHPLSRAGLLFTGANLTIRGEKVPEGMDDGILTAQEISQMNLLGAHLVVLSACSTARGEVRDDGVFGLQRGFKKAGAETLMMSLWNVYDNATQQLMTNFYRGITLQGLSPHQALQNARQQLRNSAQYNRPSMWASFILMDAI